MQLLGQELRVGIGAVLVVGQKRFQAKVEAADVTRAGTLRQDNRFLDTETHPQPPQAVALDSDRLNFAIHQSMLDELIGDLIDFKNASCSCIFPVGFAPVLVDLQQFPTGLLEGERLIALDFLEVRRMLLLASEALLVAGVEAFANLLNGSWLPNACQ